LVERLIRNEQVNSSNLLEGSMHKEGRSRMGAPFVIDSSLSRFLRNSCRLVNLLDSPALSALRFFSKRRARGAS
jgi:hypothetical protein